MKATILILAMVVAALSVIPCCAFDGTEEQNACAEAEHAQHEHECRVCSPFFSCSTCPGFTFPMLKFALVSKFAEPSKIFNLYSEEFTSSYFNSFWQPPKIS